MKVFCDKISTNNYGLAMDIIKGLETNTETKYECILRIDNERPLYEIAAYAVEPADKQPIGFADNK